MKRNNITTLELFYLITQMQIGIGIMTLPYDLQEYAKGDAWLSVLGAGILAQCMIVLYWLLCVKFPNHTLYEILPQLWGKWIGLLVKLFYVGYFVFITAIIINSFSEITLKWLLPLTPQWAITILALAAGTYLASGPFCAIVRFCVIAMIFVVVLIILVCLGLEDIDVRYILPVGQSGVNGILSGVHEALFSFSGYEVLLFAFPFVSGRVKKAKSVLLAASLANGFTTLFYVLIVLVCTMYFSPEEISLTPEPVVYLLNTYNIVLMKRVDLLFLAAWLGTVAATYGTYLFLAVSGFSRKDKMNVVLLLVAAGGCFAFSLVPLDIKMGLKDIETWLDYLGLGVIPLLLLVTAYIKREGGNS